MDARRRSRSLQHPLIDLATGQYDVQVSVLEPTGQKAAFWQAPISVVPSV